MSKDCQFCGAALLTSPCCGRVQGMKEERDEALRVREQSRLGAEREHEKVRDLRAKLDELRDRLAFAERDLEKARMAANAHECCKRSWVANKPPEEIFGPDIATYWRERASTAEASFAELKATVTSYMDYELVRQTHPLACQHADLCVCGLRALRALLASKEGAS